MTDSNLHTPEEQEMTDRLDEWTETAIREVLNAGLKHGSAAKLPPTECGLCVKPVAALRNRIRELIEGARIDDARRTDDFLRSLEGELSYEGWEIVEGYLVTGVAKPTP